MIFEFRPYLLAVCQEPRMKGGGIGTFVVQVSSVFGLRKTMVAGRTSVEGCALDIGN